MTTFRQLETMQRHIIKTQIIELQIPSQKDSFDLQNKISRICNGRLIPTLDRICSELSQPDEIHRIDRLELDLGRISHGFPEQAFIQKVEETFRQEVARNIDSYADAPMARPEQKKTRQTEPEDMEFPPYMEDELEDQMDMDAFLFEVSERFNERQQAPVKEKEQTPIQGPKSRTDLELLNFFMMTGGLPWWTDQTDRDVIAGALDRLMAQDPNSLIGLLESACADERILKRMILQFSDDQLAALVDMFRPDNALYGELNKVASKESGLEIRQGLFMTMFVHAEGIWDQGQSAKEALLHAAAVSHIPRPAFFKKVFSAMEKLRESGFVFHSKLPDITKELMSAAKETPRPLERPTEAGRHGPDLRPEIPGAKEGAFSDSEALYIGNAGLVLLTPFLPDFFGKIGLVEGDAFISGEAAGRAVLMLQYLAEGSSEVPEHALPLNKVLCGVELLEPVEMRLEASEEERRDCRALLETMIEKWPRLEDVTVDEFRAMFLLREGALSVRDRKWLLRVPSEGRDILLGDALWGIELVDLPWMRDELFVEWQ
ncbi:MAG: hypothetical protein GY849_15815 [Deltaproteobacteria bacterium]|nr:hypothetical protein [Deltaproteobacteria bacterium]